MKIAIISDIHSNLEALETALDAIQARGVDATYCLGDVVGYCSDAAACVDLVRAHCEGVVRGNHDEAVALNRGISVLPRDAQEAAMHNREQLSREQLEYLAGLPLRLVVGDCTFVHASPQAPEQWQRLETYTAAQSQFNHFDTSVCFIGHTHVPAIMANRLGVLRVRPGARYLINVGSVGQPRDMNPRLCVAFFDTESFEYELVRLHYNVERAASKILAADLPPSLADRLKAGQVLV